MNPSATVISTTDIKDIAATFPENSAERRQWLRYSNRLTRLDVAEKLGEVTDEMRQNRTKLENKIREALKPGSPMAPTMLVAPVTTPGVPSGSSSSSSGYKIGDTLPTSPGSIKTVGAGTLSNDEWKKLSPSQRNQYIQHLRNRATNNGTMKKPLSSEKKNDVFFQNNKSKEMQQQSVTHSLNGTGGARDIVLTKNAVALLVPSATTGETNYTLHT